ncbi:ninein-like isoform X1 [Lethenteron reissneri]|uniref:ninein-like isoform X1 n=1 Tax=Lethenteron reissneri TaxID=7753 RepID=UPI002AB6DE1E|nr:ninein-like isoform X1 [Lethenteron reissneri]
MDYLRIEDYHCSASKIEHCGTDDVGDEEGPCGMRCNGSRCSGPMATCENDTEVCRNATPDWEERCSADTEDSGTTEDVGIAGHGARHGSAESLELVWSECNGENGFACQTPDHGLDGSDGVVSSPRCGLQQRGGPDVDPASGGESDHYVTQLRDAFDACDRGGSGRLDHAALEELATWLQLDADLHLPLLLQKLLGDEPSATVNFEAFKKGFVWLLSEGPALAECCESQTDGELDATTPSQDDGLTADQVDESGVSSLRTDQDEAEERSEVEPKLVRGGKRYGRRSRPENSLSEQWNGDGASLGHGDGGSAGNGDEADGSSGGSDPTGDPFSPILHNGRPDVYEGGVFGPSEGTFEAEGQNPWHSSAFLSSSGVLDADPPDALGSIEERLLADLGLEPGARLDPQEAAAVCTQLQLQHEWHAVQAQLEPADDGTVSCSELLQLLQQSGVDEEGEAEPEERREEEEEDLDDERTSLSSQNLSLGRYTPSLSPPPPGVLRQLKRFHYSQEEGGRRTATPSLLAPSGHELLFSDLDDGTGSVHTERLLDSWLADGVAQPHTILEALQLSGSERVCRADLTAAIDAEMLSSGDGLPRVTLLAYKAEVRTQRSQAEQASVEREKLRVDLERTERRCSKLANETDERHDQLESLNSSRISELEQDCREKVAATRMEMDKERELIMSHVNRQREKLEAEIDNLRKDEAELRDRLGITMKENSRLERELSDLAERLADSEKQVCSLKEQLHRALHGGGDDLDPTSAEFLAREERFAHVLREHEQRCREMQDRIDELQSEVELLRTRALPRKGGRLNGERMSPEGGEELGQEDARSMSASSIGSTGSLRSRIRRKLPDIMRKGVRSPEAASPGLSIEAELVLENLKEQHQQEVFRLTEALTSKEEEFDTKLEQTRAEAERRARDAEDRLEAKVADARARHSALEVQVASLRELVEEARAQRDEALARLNEKRAEAEEKACLLDAISKEHVQQLEKKVEEGRQEAFKSNEQAVQRLRVALSDKEQEVDRVSARLREAEKESGDLQSQLSAKDEEVTSIKRKLDEVEREKGRILSTTEADIEKIHNKLQANGVDRAKDYEAEKLQMQAMLKRQKLDMEKKLQMEKAEVEQHFALQVSELARQLGEERERMQRELTDRHQAEMAQQSVGKTPGHVKRVHWKEDLEGCATVNKVRNEDGQHLDGALAPDRCQPKVKLKPVMKISKPVRSAELEGQAKGRRVQGTTAAEKGLDENIGGNTWQDAKRVRKSLQSNDAKEDAKTRIAVIVKDGNPHCRQDNINVGTTLSLMACAQRKDALFHGNGTQIDAGKSGIEEPRLNVNRCLDVGAAGVHKGPMLPVSQVQRSVRHGGRPTSSCAESETELGVLQPVGDVFINGLEVAAHADAAIAIESSEEYGPNGTAEIELGKEAVRGQVAIPDIAPRGIVWTQWSVNENVKNKVAGCRGVEDEMSGENERTVKKQSNSKGGDAAELEDEVKSSIGAAGKERAALQAAILRWSALARRLERERVAAAERHRKTVEQLNKENLDAKKIMESLNQQVLDRSAEVDTLHLDNGNLTSQCRSLQAELEALSRKVTSKDQQPSHPQGLDALVTMGQNQTEAYARLEEPTSHISSGLPHHPSQKEMVARQPDRAESSPCLEGPTEHVSSGLPHHPRQNETISEQSGLVEASSYMDGPSQNGARPCHPSGREAITKQREQAEASHRLEAEQQRQKEAEARIARLEATVEAAELKVRLLEEERRTLKRDLAASKDKAFYRAAEDVSQLSTLAKDRDLLQEERDVLSRELDAYRTQVTRLSHVEREVGSLRENKQKLEQHSQAMSEHLHQSSEKIKSLDTSLLSATAQTAALQSDLRLAQQERETLRQEVVSMTRALQLTRDKAYALECSAQAASDTSQQKQLFREGVTRLTERELREQRSENDHLAHEAQLARAELAHARDKVSQLEMAMASLQQNGHMAHARLLQLSEQEVLSLRGRVDALQAQLRAHQEKVKQMGEVEVELQQARAESSRLREENAQMQERLSNSLRQAQSHVPLARLEEVRQRLAEEEQRVRHLESELEHGRSAGSTAEQQEAYERMLKSMGSRMEEVEGKLKSVRVMLQEKVTQLREQLNRNEQADMRIKDLYVENSKLMKDLQLMEQRQRTAERKSFLLEEKVVALNKLLRKLVPEPLQPML